MVEIVFSESACGSLKIAQTYGRGKYRGSAISVFIRHENGSVPSSNEMKEAQLQAQEQECIAWENAIPLGVKSSDVYCFDMALSVGDISDNGIGELVVLGRNGSDYSAAVLAACLRADCCEIWTDVDGGLYLRPASGARCEVVEVDVLPGSDGAFLLRR